MNRSRENRAKGILGEEVVASFLIREGYTVLARNFRIRIGEADIIARKGEQLFFIEVKHWSSVGFSHPLEVFSVGKRRKMRAVAEAYLNRNVSLKGCSVSFCLAFLNEKRELNFYRNLF